MRRRYADAGTGQIHIREWAAVEDSTQPPLVLLQPSPYSGSYFETVAPLLNAGRLVIAPDFPGYGGSDPTPDKPSIADYASATIEALRNAYPDHQTFDLSGFHTGCLAAFEMSLIAPDMVNRLVPVDVPYFDAEAQAKMYPSTAADVVFTPELESLAAAWKFSVENRVKDISFERAWDMFCEQLRAGTRGAWAFHAAFTYDCAARISAVTHPTRLIATQSGLLEPTRATANAIPHAELIERLDVTRAVMELGAEAMAAEILEYLSD